MRAVCGVWSHLRQGQKCKDAALVLTATARAAMRLRLGDLRAWLRTGIVRAAGDNSHDGRMSRAGGDNSHDGQMSRASASQYKGTMPTTSFNTIVCSKSKNCLRNSQCRGPRFWVRFSR